MALADRIAAVRGENDPPPRSIIPAQFRDPLGHFLPGNPGSALKPKAEYGVRVRERTRDGDLLIDVLLEVVAGLTPLEDVDLKTGRIRRPASCEPTAADRLRAVAMLEQRGWGKVPDKVEFQGQVSTLAVNFDVSRLEPNDVATLLELRRKARGDDPEPGLELVEGEVIDAPAESAP
jgi:hypothetical protein